MNKDKSYFMKQALKEAQKALLVDEVPIGCVIVLNNKIIARGYNKREERQDVSSHAEMEAIRKANKKLNSWRLVDCDIYVTLEPCLMCMGAIIQSRIKNIYYGTLEPKGGAIESSIKALEANNINHHPNAEGGIMQKECSEIISSYFRMKRRK